MSPPSLQDLFPLQGMSGLWDITLVTKRPVRGVAEGSLALWPGGEHLREEPRDLFGRTTVRYLWFGGLAAELTSLRLDQHAVPLAVEDSSYMQVAVTVDSTNARMHMGLGNDHQQAAVVFWVIEYQAAERMRGVLVGSGQAPEGAVEGYFCATFRNAV